MVANIRGYTPNYSFKLINFDTPRWHTLEYDNWNLLDAMLQQVGIPELRGTWTNSTLYNIGDRVFDILDGSLWRALVAHTSATSGTFAADRLAHPTYWALQLSGVPLFRGGWTPSSTYTQGDIVYHGAYSYYLCTKAHTSGTTFPPDLALNVWQLVFDATAAVGAAQASADAAAISESNAANSANSAADDATDAAASADLAEQFALNAANQGDAFRWNFDPLLTIENPGIGDLRFNSPLPDSITAIIISAQSADTGNPDVSNWIATWDDSTNTASKGTIYVRKTAAPENFLIFNLTDTVTDNGTWMHIGVTYAAHSGTLAAGEIMSVSIARTGDTGSVGSGAGDMLAANYLSELSGNKPLARTNLDLGATDDPTFAQVHIGAATLPDHAVSLGHLEGVGGLLDGKVDIAGDIMTGPLILQANVGTNATLSLSKPTTHNNDIWGMNNGSTRWLIRPGDAVPDGVGNAGTDFSILAFDNAGVYLNTPMHITRATGRITLVGDPLGAGHAVNKNYADTTFFAKTGGVLTGDILLDGADPTISFTKDVGHVAQIYINTDVAGVAKTRWLIRLSDSDAEAGSNSGSTFIIYRCNDAGAVVEPAISISRATGLVGLVSTTPTAPNHAATKGYVDSTAGSSKPAFNAFLSGAQTITNEVWTTVLFNTTSLNQGSFFNTPGYYWQPSAGMCHLHANVVFGGGLLAGTPIHLAILKNGVMVFVAVGAAVSSGGGASISAMDQCNGSDYYQVQVYAYTMPSNATLQSGFTYTRFHGSKI